MAYPSFFLTIVIFMRFSALNCSGESRGSETKRKWFKRQSMYLDASQVFSSLNCTSRGVCDKSGDFMGLYGVIIWHSCKCEDNPSRFYLSILYYTLHLLSFTGDENVHLAFLNNSTILILWHKHKVQLFTPVVKSIFAALL